MTDWNQAWREARALATRKGGAEAWDRRAPSFARHAARSGYVERMLELVAPEPGWTVLDVGCGSGALAIPLARRVRAVTALDFSPRMLELLRARCADAGIANVTPLLGAWEDDWDRLGVGACDVALASRSLTVDDLGAALLKLHRAARRRAFVTAPVGTGPVDPRVLEAVGRPWRPGPDYVYVESMLRQLGLRPSVELVPVVQARCFPTLDDAVDGVGWTVPDASPDERRRLRAWLERELAPCDEGLALPPRTIRWAVLSWSGGAPAA